MPRDLREIGLPRPAPKPKPRQVTLNLLRGIIDKPFTPTGEFRLDGRIEDAIPKAIMDEDTDMSLRRQAGLAYLDELRTRVNAGNTELLEKRARLRFIRGSYGYGDHRLAQRMEITLNTDGDRKLASFLGITPDQVKREDLRGRRIAEVDRFEERFNGLFTLSSILAESEEDVIDRRVALETPNGKLSNVSISDAIKAGFINIAVAIALEAVRQNEESRDNQRIPEPVLS